MTVPVPSSPQPPACCVPVIFCNDAHRPGIDRELLIWGDHAIVGTPGAQVIPELPIHKEDFVVPKRRYSGFFQTDLDILLKELGVKTVVITGLHTHMCCRHTSADAFCLGYDVVVAKEATNSFTEEDYPIPTKNLSQHSKITSESRADPADRPSFGHLSLGRCPFFIIFVA